MDDRIELGEDGAWYAEWGERWESDEALLQDNWDVGDEWPSMKRAVAKARRRIEARERAEFEERQRTPGTDAYRSWVEAQGQGKLL